MSIPDLTSPPEISGVSKTGLKYHLIGTVQPTVAIYLEPGQVVFSDTGAMSWMSGSVEMRTNAGGGLGGMFKRAISGASAFLIDFSAPKTGGHVAFSSDFPGKIVPMELEENQSVIMHKHAFLCAEKSVHLDVFFTKSLGAGLFGGEGFILQKLTGPGIVFGELDGDAVEYFLKPGEVMKVEPGHVAMFEESVHFDVTLMKGITNLLFSGEGIFLATLTGPGRIWLHSMTASKIAHRVAEYLPSK